VGVVVLVVEDEMIVVVGEAVEAAVVEGAVVAVEAAVAPVVVTVTVFVALEPQAADASAIGRQAEASRRLIAHSVFTVRRRRRR
jgi:hypothetical protein